MTVAIDQVSGRGISGTITRPFENQANPLAWLETLDALLVIEGVESVSWQQYTPYWNDGEQTEFSISTWNMKARFNGGAVLDFDDIPYKGDLTPLEKTFQDFGDTTQSSSHYNYLRNTFGEHAEVTATLSGFNVESFTAHD